MLRKFYYFLSPSSRYLIRRIIYFPTDLIASFKNELRPPRGMIYTGSKDFIQQGRDWKDLFIQYGHLLPDHHVLDIGSGIGRIALGLLPFLKGKYEGFDAVKLGVDWCRKNISAKNPNFHFQFIDLYNDLYKNNGINASDFNFPYVQESFDFACAISVFTHMLPEEVDQYIQQLQSILKVNGHAVLTFFILDDESIRYMNAQKDGIRFKYMVDQNHALMDASVKSANVAYRRVYLDALLKNNNLMILYEFKGRWCGRPQRSDDHPLAFQDILVIKKIN